MGSSKRSHHNLLHSADLRRTSLFAWEPNRSSGHQGNYDKSFGSIFWCPQKCGCSLTAPLSTGRQCLSQHLQWSVENLWLWHIQEAGWSQSLHRDVHWYFFHFSLCFVNCKTCPPCDPLPVPFDPCCVSCIIHPGALARSEF